MHLIDFNLTDTCLNRKYQCSLCGQLRYQWLKNSSQWTFSNPLLVNATTSGSLWSQLWEQNITILHVSSLKQVGQASAGHMLTQSHNLLIKIGLAKKHRAFPQEETQTLIFHCSEN